MSSETSIQSVSSKGIHERKFFSPKRLVGIRREWNKTKKQLKPNLKSINIFLRKIKHPNTDNFQQIERIIHTVNLTRFVDEISKALERDNFMTPDDAKEFGLIDKVVDKR